MLLGGGHRHEAHPQRAAQRGDVPHADARPRAGPGPRRRACGSHLLTGAGERRPRGSRGRASGLGLPLLFHLKSEEERWATLGPPREEGGGRGGDGERPNPKALRKGRRPGTGMREGVSRCAGERPWSWRAPAWAPHMRTARHTERQAGPGGPALHGTCTCRPSSAPSPPDAGPRPASGLPACPAAAAASAPTPRGRLVSQTQAVPPAASSESLPRLISLSSLPLSLFLSLPLPPLPSSLCYPPRLTPVPVHCP